MKRVLFIMMMMMFFVSCESFQFSSITTTVVIKGERVAVTTTKTNDGIMASVNIRGYIFECGEITGANELMDRDVVIDDYEITKSIKFKIAGKDVECRLKE